MSIINKILVGTMIVGAGVVTSGCEGKPSQTKSRESVMRQVMADEPAESYIKITEKFRNGNAGVVDSQHALDSVAYRQVFESTHLANDSVAVKEFNQIAQKTKPNQRLTLDYDLMNNIDRKIRGTRISTREYFDLKNQTKYGYRSQAQDCLAKKQFQLDSIMYSRFFEKNNLMNDSVSVKLAKTIEKIRPNRIKL